MSDVPRVLGLSTQRVVCAVVALPKLRTMLPVFSASLTSHDSAARHVYTVREVRRQLLLATLGTRLELVALVAPKRRTVTHDSCRLLSRITAQCRLLLIWLLPANDLATQWCCWEACFII